MIDKIKEQLRYLRGFPRVFLWKLKYKEKLQISFKHNFRKRVNLHISGSSRVQIEDGLSNRDSLEMRVEEGNLHIGKNCFFNLNCSITCADKIEIGDNCLFANNVVIVDHDHDYRNGQKLKKTPIFIGNNVWIGANCVILRGTYLGDNCVVGAGTILSGVYKNNTKIIQTRQLKIEEIKG